jgi:adenosylcobinamide amidohydrolase
VLLKKKYIYHVTYSFQGGLGRTNMIMNKKINTQAIVTEVEEYIKNQQNLKNVFLTNWIRLKK